MARGIPWADQLANGRVFELRSTSKRYPAPCALVIDQDAKTYGPKMVVGVDKFGVVGDGMYTRSHNPDIYVDGLRGKGLTSRIVRRRRELERFDCFDLDIIRYGLAVDFDGRIHGYSQFGIPTAGPPASWTVFWIPALAQSDFFWPNKNITDALRGAWHFSHHGGPRNLGYKYGHMWATRHTGKRLDTIRRMLRSLRGDLIEQHVDIVRWNEGDSIFMSSIHRRSPVLSGGWTTVKNPRGESFSCYA